MQHVHVHVHVVHVHVHVTCTCQVTSWLMGESKVNHSYTHLNDSTVDLHTAPLATARGIRRTDGFPRATSVPVCGKSGGALLAHSVAGRVMTPP